jgi:hypothetical protein
MDKNAKFVCFLDELTTKDNKFLIESIKKGFSLLENEDSSYKYANIVFMQGDQAEEPLQILNEKGDSELVAYLSQWDNGEYYDLTDHVPWGKSDTVKYIGEYILTYNTPLGYVGLSRKIKNDE